MVPAKFPAHRCASRASRIRSSAAVAIRFRRTLKTLALEFRDLCFGYIQFELEFYPLAIRLSEFRDETCGFLLQAIDLHFI
jgi:hypothetical protein